MKLLPTFKGYIVDEAAQRFRKVTTSKGKPSIYIPFNSSQGQKMRKEFVPSTNSLCEKCVTNLKSGKLRICYNASHARTKMV